MKIRYIGPIDEIELPDGQTVKHNHQAEVDDAVAGRPPEPRLAEAMAELAAAAEARDHPLQVKLRHEITTLDDGEGLLAQADNFESVTPSKKGETK